MSFGGGSPPPVPAPPPLPERSDLEARERERREKERLARMKGRKSTILTGPEGVKGEAPVEKKSLLGE